MPADPKVKRKKLPSLKKLATILDVPFSKIIRARDAIKTGGRCVFGCGRPIQCAFHFIRKSRSLKMRWDRRNVVGSCGPCNGYMENNEGPFWTWYAKNYGVEQMEAIQNGSHGAANYSRAYLMGLFAEFEAEVAALPPGAVPS